MLIQNATLSNGLDTQFGKHSRACTNIAEDVLEEVALNWERLINNPNLLASTPYSARCHTQDYPAEMYAESTSSIST